MMSSPSLDVIAKRRYHKQKHRKSRKKSCLGREVQGKTIPPPKISKRLTSGFCFRGAVVTSSHSRNPRGVNAIKTRKSSTDYDLHCLLKAAKSHVVSDHSQSPSTGISAAEDIDDPIENHPSISSYKQKPSKQRASIEIDVDTGTSCGNRVPFGHEEQDSETTMQVEQVPIYKQDNSGHLRKQYHISSAKDHNTDFNNSSENSSTHAKPKPHISSYQKFAVGIVEEVVSEKKKQFPNLGLSKQIKQELINIYQRTKNASDMTKNAPAKQMPIPQYCNSEHCEAESENQLLPQTRKVNPGIPDYKSGMGQKSFKERTVEAWIEAIPQGSADKNERLQKYQGTKPKCERSSKQTESDFMENVKKGHNIFKPYSCTSKEEIPPLWFTDVKSPSFSPFLNTGKKAASGQVALPHESQDSHKNKLNCMKLNFNFPLEKEQRCRNPPRALQSWTTWFKGNDDIVDQRQPDSPIYPSPLFMFDQPPYKKTNVTLKEGSTSVGTHHQTKTIEHKSSVWSQFPKFLKKDEKEVFKGIHGQKEMFSYNQNESKLKENVEPTRHERIVKNQSPAYIHFSPRKMF
ncbi:uncharacterized protein LOC117653974 [Thrips palmi]|uniref:Uncharacterized protein LOC117653974 n=1 Tax=Thrips palmi TaxID=161013 RepID=A0A6P9AEQ2_THRPL|nr:uncharacterized protein LOC117653974 [Thrips palmi]